MRQAVIRKPYQVAIEDLPEPKPLQDELLVKTEITGISAGTEMALFRGSHPNLTTKKWGYWTDFPVYPGYEVVGTVIEVGSQVEGFKVGDKIVGCGCHAEIANVPSNYAVKLSAEIPPESATLAILGTTTMHAVRRGNLAYGGSVAVIGLGVVGMLALLHAKLAGASRVVAIDFVQERLDLASSYGVDAAVSPDDPDFQCKIHEATNGGADLVIEAAGTPSAIVTATQIARARGAVVILGYHVKPVQLLFGDDLFHKELDIRVSKAMGPHPSLAAPNAQWGAWVAPRWSVDQSLYEVVHLMETGRFVVEPLITHRFPASELPSIYEKLDAGEMKDALQIILEW